MVIVKVFVGSLTVAEAVAVHPLKSVIVIVWVPAPTADKSSEVGRLIFLFQEEIHHTFMPGQTAAIQRM